MMPVEARRRPAIGFSQAEDYRALRGVLSGAGFTEEGVRKALGFSSVSAPKALDKPLILDRTAGGTPVETLIRLLIVGIAVEAEAVRRAIAPMTIEQWIEAGLIEAEGRSVRALVRLMPLTQVLGMWLVHDGQEQKHCRDYVMGMSPSTIGLADATVRRPVGRTLDLGAGCGVHALLAARHSGRVIAADRNPRAAQMARFNARLNRVQNMEVVEGDLFGPVAGQRFDLIVSNPPFVITPGVTYFYRDGGMRGDDLCRRIVREAPAMLADGGFCQMLANWAHVKGGDWKAQLAGWFDDCGCDVWAIRHETRDAGTYASRWIDETETADLDGQTALYDRWMRYYQRLGIEAVSLGLIVMRRRSSGAGRLRIDESASETAGPYGDDILLRFELGDFLETHREDRDLLDVKLRIAPQVRLQQELAPAEDGWSLDRMELRRIRGLLTTGRVDAYAAGLVGRCNGRRTLRGLIEELAAGMERDVDAVAGPAVAMVRDLVEQAFLLPEGVGDRPGGAA